jgi:hypothetical protein
MDPAAYSALGHEVFYIPLIALLTSSAHELYISHHSSSYEKYLPLLSSLPSIAFHSGYPDLLSVKGIFVLLPKPPPVSVGVLEGNSKSYDCEATRRFLRCLVAPLRTS